MSGFLDRLVGMAICDQAPGAARVSLPPRFALSPAAAGMSQRRQVALEENPVAIPESLPLEAPQYSSSFSLSSNATATRPATTKDAHVKPPSSETTSVPPAVSATARDVPAASRPAATLASFEPSPPPRTAVRSILPTLPAPGRVTPAAPLSDAAVAGRVSNPRNDRPVIHVTIDRIDVRAPAAAKPGPSPRRARPEPTISLSEYLRRSEPGGRA